MQSITKQKIRHDSHINQTSDHSSEAIWVREEFAYTDLGDERLNQRLCALVEDFISQPQASIPKATGGWGQACGAYRFFDNQKVTMSNLLGSHQEKTLERVKEQKVILAVQDSTSLNFTTHGETQGLGPIGDKVRGALGIWLHTTMLLNGEGLPLGLLDVQSWARDPQEFGKSKKRHDKPIEVKESMKWLKSYEACEQAQRQGDGPVWVNIGDRESDLYELFSLALNRENKTALLIRAMHNRQVLEEQKDLWSFLQSQPEAGTLIVKVPRQKGRKSRSATLSIRFGEVRLKAPRRKKELGCLSLWGILAEEVHPPEGVKPIRWRLLTSLEVRNLSSAIEKIQWYVIRWQIEVFHKVLKSGCRVEDRQLESVHRLQRVVVIDMIVAWRILYLTKLGRETSNHSASEILDENEWKALYCFVHKTTQLPHEPPSLRESVMMIAGLGGFLGRKSDGFPGNICLWRGLHRLHDITATWLIFNSTKNVRND